MTIQLSTITFTEQDDIVPLDEEEDIYNNGITNTLAGNDLIIGTSDFTTHAPGISNGGSIYSGDGDDKIIGINDDSASGIYHLGISNYSASIDTGNGNDIITGISYREVGAGIESRYGTINTGDGNDVITGIIPSVGTGINSQHTTINTGDGNDAITGTGGQQGISIGAGGLDTGKDNDIITGTGFFSGISISGGFLNTGDGNDTITGNNTAYHLALSNGGIIDTGEGDDIITGTNTDSADGNSYPVSTGIGNRGAFYTGDGNDTITGISTTEDGNGFVNGSTIDTGDGKDIIIGTGKRFGIINERMINTGNGADSLISNGKLRNTGGIFLGESNDSIIVDTDLPNPAIENFSMIATGDGNDTITSKGVIYNEAVIDTGNGEDSIITDGGFQSGSSGLILLGEGEDYIKGFGSGDFNGGNDNDILELTSGIYTFGISPLGGNFAKDGIIMNTVGFEKLIAGSTSYDFTSLSEGQTIIVV